MAYLLEMIDSAMDSEDGPVKTTWIPSGKWISIFASPSAGCETLASCTGINPEPGLAAKLGFLTDELNWFLTPDFRVSR